MALAPPRSVSNTSSARWVLARLQLHSQALGQVLAHAERAQRLAVHLCLVAAVHRELESWALAEHLGHPLQLLSLGGQHDIAARLEGDGLQALRVAAEQPAQGSERGRHDLGDDGDQRLPDEMAVAELW